MSKFKIEQTGRHVRVWLEDIEITKSLASVDISIDYHGQMTVTLNVAVTEICIDSLAEKDHTMLVQIPDATADTLQLLGWVKTDRTTYTIPRDEEELIR